MKVLAILAAVVAAYCIQFAGKVGGFTITVTKDLVGNVVQYALVAVTIGCVILAIFMERSVESRNSE